MATNYDDYYKQPHALGEPTQAFVDFFKTYEPQNAKVLDIGCGQGRDALFIARLGHHVTGVDISARGISQMLREAIIESLPIEGITTDICDYELTDQFDVIVIDRTLHMLDRLDRQRVFKRLIRHVEEHGYILLSDEKTNLPDFEEILAQSDADWETLLAGRGYLFLQKA